VRAVVIFVAHNIQDALLCFFCYRNHCFSKLLSTNQYKGQHIPQLLQQRRVCTMSFFWLTGGVVDDQSNTAIIYRLSNYLPTPIAERYIIAFLSPFDRVKDDQKTIERRWK